jgi:hypothetical protein
MAWLMAHLCLGIELEALPQQKKFGRLEDHQLAENSLLVTQ